MEAILGNEGDVKQMLKGVLHAAKPDIGSTPASGAAGFARIV
jgi:hypothetical protein